MKRKKHSESEMVKAVKELESGVSAEVVAREYGISKATLYQWKSKFCVLNVVDDNDRVALAQEVLMLVPSKRLIRTLEKVIWLLQLSQAPREPWQHDSDGVL